MGTGENSRLSGDLPSSSVSAGLRSTAQGTDHRKQELAMAAEDTQIADTLARVRVARPALGPIGRLGGFAATHFRGVALAWVAVALALGFLAPRVETALSGAGWEASGSQSVQARQLIERNFQGLSSYALTTVVYSPTRTVTDARFREVLAGVEGT